MDVKRIEADLFRIWTLQYETCTNKGNIQEQEHPSSKKETTNTTLQAHVSILQAPPHGLCMIARNSVTSPPMLIPNGHTLKSIYDGKESNGMSNGMISIPKVTPETQTAAKENVGTSLYSSHNTSDVTRERAVKKGFKTSKRNSDSPNKIEQVKTKEHHRLIFAMTGTPFLNLKSLLIDKGWTQTQWKKKQALHDATNTKDIQLLVLGNSSLSNNIWRSINIKTAVNCFPRLGNTGEENVVNWVLNETVSPSTFIVTTDSPSNSRLFEFINEFLKATCHNVMQYTRKNQASLFSSEAREGIIPLWILTYAVHNCGGMSMSCREYFSVTIPREAGPRIQLEMNKKRREQRQCLMNKQHEFLEYAHALLNEGACFEKSSNLDGEVIVRMSRKMKSLCSKSASQPNVHSDTWIIKAGSSTGHGIRRFRRLLFILDHLNKDEYSCRYYMLQKFICNQFLINGSHFKIHHFVLLADLNPLKVVTLQFEIVINSSDFESIYEYEEDKITWSPKQFMSYLSSVNESGDCWKKHVQPSIQKATSHILQQNVKSLIPKRNSFEIICSTFVLDDKLQPWLVNMKTNPSDNFLSNNLTREITYKCILDKVLNIS